MRRIKLDLGARSYEIVIDRGLRTRLGGEIAKVWTPRQVLLLTDDHVGPLHLQQASASLTAAGFAVTEMVVPHGEGSKSLSELERVYNVMADAHMTRSAGVVALGGGVCGDLAGFAAATYMRGVAFIQVPTSLTAQVDSSVGGKTAINLGPAKNTVGSFYQPDLVLVDPDYLDTLSDRYLTEGYAEVLKMATLTDPARCWQLLADVNSAADIRRVSPELIDFAIHYKASVVAADERDLGLRQLLNFGHTLGHAIELLAHGDLAHGEAVSVGMVQLTRITEARGLTTPGTADQIAERLRAVGLPIDSPLLHDADLLPQILMDKKMRSNQLNLVVLKQIGDPEILPVKRPDVAEFLNLQEA